MKPLTAGSPQYSPVPGPEDDHRVTVPVTSAGAVLSGAPALSQRSVNAEKPVQPGFDPESVEFVQNIASRIREKQSLHFLQRELSKELQAQQWSVKFRHYSDPCHFYKYSGYVFDSDRRPRINFRGSVIHDVGNCSATELSFEESERAEGIPDIDELHDQPRNEFPEDESLRIFYLWCWAADLQRGES